MVQTAIAKAITTLDQVAEAFNLHRTDDPLFFTEWASGLPQLTDADKAVLDQIKHRFRYHRAAGFVEEGAVNLLVVSRLLELAGFYDPPFRIRSEVSVEIQSQIQDEPLRGRMDFLVIQNRFWRTVIESKDTEFDVEVGIPQMLAYMMANPQASQPLFGMVTNGNSYVFLKLVQQPMPQYDISNVYTLLPRQNQLYEVLQILKQIAQVVVSPES